MRISLMPLPFRWLEMHPARASTRMKVVVSLSPLWLLAHLQHTDMGFCTKSLLTAKNSSDGVPWDADTWGMKNSKSLSNTTGTVLRLRWYTPVALRKESERKRERTAAKQWEHLEKCVPPPNRLSESISNWNYLWAGINRSFYYEAGWHKKGTNTTKMQLMNLFVTRRSGKLQCDTHHIHNDSLQLWEKENWVVIWAYILQTPWPGLAQRETSDMMSDECLSCICN